MDMGNQTLNLKEKCPKRKYDPLDEAVEDDECQSCGGYDAECKMCGGGNKFKEWGDKLNTEINSEHNPKCPACSSDITTSDGIGNYKCQECRHKWNENDPEFTGYDDSQEHPDDYYFNESLDYDEHDWKTGHEKEECPCCHGEGCKFCDSNDNDSYVEDDPHVLADLSRAHGFDDLDEAKETNEKMNEEWQWTSPDEPRSTCRRFGHRFETGDGELLSFCGNCFKSKEEVDLEGKQQVDDPDVFTDLARTHGFEKPVTEGQMFDRVKEFVSDTIDNLAFGGKPSINVETNITHKLLTNLEFEQTAKEDEYEIWKRSYYNVIFGPVKKNKLGWLISRNGKPLDKGFGSKTLMISILMEPEFQGEIKRLVDKNNAEPVKENKTIIDDLIHEYLGEADVPASNSWGSPLTFVNADLPNSYRTSKEIARHKNTTGKLSPFSLLNKREEDKDSDGNDLNRITDLAGLGRPIQSANASGVSGQKGNEQPSNL
jgi:hypothetical protein